MSGAGACRDHLDSILDDQPTKPPTEPRAGDCGIANPGGAPCTKAKGHEDEHDLSAYGPWHPQAPTNPRAHTATREADPDNDEFQCVQCKRIMDVENSIRQGDELICEDCNESPAASVMAAFNLSDEQYDTIKAIAPDNTAVLTAMVKAHADLKQRHAKLVAALRACQARLHEDSCEHGDAEDGLLPPDPQNCLNCEVNAALANEPEGEGVR